MTNRIRTYLSIIPIAVLTLNIQAEPAGVRGIIIDPLNWPVQGARVTCGTETIQSAFDGRFHFSGVDQCLATISAQGFDTQERQLTSATVARVELAVAGVTERVVVTATRHETTAEKAGVAANIVTRTDLAVLQYPMLLDVLREVPGLQVARSGREGGLTSVYTRGAQRTGTLVLLDGMPINDPGGEINFGHLTSSTIDRVEIVRGPESALFGAEASAAAVQLFTMRGDPESKVPHGSFSYERGTFQTDRWMASITGGSGSRVDYALGVEQLHTVGEFPNDYYRNTMGSANLGLQLAPTTQLRGVYRSYDSAQGVPGQVAYGLFDLDAHQTNRGSTFSLRLDDMRSPDFVQNISFGYHRLRDVYTDRLGDGPYTVGALVRDVSDPLPRTYRVRLVDPVDLPLPPSEIPPGTRLVSREYSLWAMPEPYIGITARKRLGYQGNWNHLDGTLVFGYDFERQEGDVSNLPVSRNNHGLFLHRQQAFGQRVFLSGGVRLEKSSVFGTKFTPRGAASFFLFGEHGPLSSTSVRVSAGRGITEPSLLQNFARESYYVGNPDLHPEKTSSYEAGLVQEWFGRRLRTEAAVFHNSFRDLIVFVSLPPPVWGSWDNVEASRARGVEFSAKARVAEGVVFTSSYTRLWTRIIKSSAPDSPFTGIGQELGRRPGNSGALSLSVTRSLWWFQAGAVLVGERQDTDLFGVTRNPGYQNVYAGASFRLNPHVTPFVKVDNLLNRRYEEVLGYSNLARSIRGGIRVEW